ncbi:MarR family winged helix-turn-helix transcriptional regulator [Sphingobium phenoxybenzoativorans]|uniref:MarR family winged helix-turn-helix transcriptional regulator n=1 Tax=Sphingobium phenoxybenzoativorans TaxID=1592790 RepID=UPI000871CC91|nr:MarR family transcriptional regulator [Sphingobium phenoxybenzoativorans]
MARDIPGYEGKPGHWARRFQQIAVAVFQSEVEAAGYDLTPVQYAALEAIAALPRIDQATLAGQIGFDRATITGVIDRLESKELVSRRVSKVDRRARELDVTAKGAKLLVAVRPHVERAQAIMTRGLTDRELGELMRLLKKVVEAANDLSRAPKS